MRIICTEKELHNTEPDELMEIWELVQEDVAEHGLKNGDYQSGHICIEIEG